MNMTFVLIMIFSHYKGGYGVVQQEFTSLATCEVARTVLAQAHGRGSYAAVELVSQGCYPK